MSVPRKGQCFLLPPAAPPPRTDPISPLFEHAGENFELRADLNSEYREKRADAIKRVIANMTVGKDVSGLFPDGVSSLARPVPALVSVPQRLIQNVLRHARFAVLKNMVRISLGGTEMRWKADTLSSLPLANGRSRTEEGEGPLRSSFLAEGRCASDLTNLYFLPLCSSCTSTS